MTLPEVLIDAVGHGQLRAFTPGLATGLFGDQVDTARFKTVDREMGLCPGVVHLAEDWIFDEARGEMYPRIIAIGLLLESAHPDGCAHDGKEVFCWIPFNEARTLLTGHMARIPLQGQEALSWDDVLVLHAFSSHVIKESNVLDQSISDYASGRKAIMEEINIEQNIFRFEDTLWPEQ